MSSSVSSPTPPSQRAPVAAAGQPPFSLTARTVQVLKGVQRRVLWTQWAEFPVRLAIVLPILFVLQGCGDWMLHLSPTARGYLLGVDGLVVAYFFVRFLVYPYYKRLDLRAATLLIERKIPEFRTALISAVELTTLPTRFPALLRTLVLEVDGLVGKSDIPRRVVQTGGLKRRLRHAFVVLLLFGLAGWYFYPTSWFLGRRMLLSQDAFPRLTTVHAITKDAVVAAGADLEVSARASGVVPRSGQISVAYDDGRLESAPVSPLPTSPDTFSFLFKNVRAPFKYRFTLNDGTGEQYRVITRTLLGPSEVHFTQTYPAYTGLHPMEMSPANLALMAGGRVWIVTKANKPIKSATLTELGPGKTQPMQMNNEDKKLATLDLFLEKNATTGFSVHFVGADGEQSENDPIYHVEMTVDKPPVVSIRTPREDKITVISDDKLPLSFSAHDDFGIKKIELVYEIFHVGTEGDVAPAARGRIPLDAFEADKDAVRTFVWDLGKVAPPLNIGYSANFWIEATDNDAVFGPNVGRSKRKALIVVSEDAKKAELIEALSKKAGEIERVYELQQRLNQRTDAALRNQTAHP